MARCASAARWPPPPTRGAGGGWRLATAAGRVIEAGGGCGRARGAGAGEGAGARLARRGLGPFKEEAGLGRCPPLLPAEPAAVVVPAIEAVAAEQPPVPIQDT